MLSEQTERLAAQPGADAAPTRRPRGLRTDWPAVAAILAGGLLVLALNAGLPITRNAFKYAKASASIVATGYDPLAVIADPSLSYGKPIGFPVLAVPLNLLIGPNLGMKVLSFLGTALFALAAWYFFARVNADRGIDARLLPLEMALLFGNPLMVYQFWSGYPDTLFAAEVLAAFLLSDRIARGRPEGAARNTLLLGAVILVAILTKLYALILGLACPLYIIVSWLGSRPAWAAIEARVAWLTAVFGLLGVAVLSARKGLNPLIDLGASGAVVHSAGYEELETGLGVLSPAIVLLVVASWVVAQLVTFGVSLLFVCWRGRASAWPRAWTCFTVVFLLGLIPFGMDIVYNIRYFIPVFPFAVVAIAGGIAAAQRSPWKKWILATHAGIATLLTLHYNVPRAYAALTPLREAFLDPILGKGERLENLRMGQHLELARQVAQINGLVEPGGTLFWLCTYGDNATHGVIEDVIRRDIQVRYGSVSYVRAETNIYVAEDRIYPQTSPWMDDTRFRSSQLGEGVVLLEPRVALAGPRQGQSFALAESVPLLAKVPGVDVSPSTWVEFLIDGQVIATDHEPPYEATWRGTDPGRHHAAARVYAPRGEVSATGSRPFFIGVQAVERAIADCRDDVEEDARGVVVADSSDLEMTRDSDRGDQVVGLRFMDVSVPVGARINEAYLQFTAYGASAKDAQLELRAELSASAVRFGERAGPAARRTGSAAVLWQPPAWDRAGERSVRQRSPDLSTLIQEVVAGPGWQAGNALAVVIRGFGVRVARSCDGASVSGDEPSLYIDYETPSGSEPARPRGGA